MCSATRSSVLRGLLLGALVAAGVAAIVLLPLRAWTVTVLTWAAGRGAWTGVLLAAVWVPAALLFFPGSLITLGTGFLMGLKWGTVVVSIGSTLGALAAFLAGRNVARAWVERRVSRRPAFHAIDRAVGRDGLRVVLLTRLSPIFPYNLLNYAYGVTSVRFRDFAWGSWVGMLPGTILYVYLGTGAAALASVATGTRAHTRAELLFGAIGLVATVVVTVLVTRRARRALREEVGVDDTA